MNEVKVGDTVSATIVSYQNPNDPYDTPEEHAEANDYIFNTFFFWTGAGGTFSTWRERHIFLRGFFSGFNTKLQDTFKEVPDIWYEEAQYYNFGQEAGYIVRNAIIFGLSGVVATEAVTNAPTILTLLKTLIGL